jgi:hypothetical protein
LALARAGAEVVRWSWAEIIDIRIPITPPPMTAAELRLRVDAVAERLAV